MQDRYRILFKRIFNKIMMYLSLTKEKERSVGWKMKQKILSIIIATALIVTMIPDIAIAAEGDNETTIEEQFLMSGDEFQDRVTSVSGNTAEVTGGTTGENKETEQSRELTEEEHPIAVQNMDPENTGYYEVSTDDELCTALEKINVGDREDVTIVIKNDVKAPTQEYVSSFGADGKHITVISPEGELHTISFSNRGMLTGSCTFDNVTVTGYKLYCNGYRTIFTENGQIHLTGTLYGGGYKTTVGSTYVVIDANGNINPYATNGLHNVIGGSYQGSVTGDTYLEITGNLQMQGGNHINPGCAWGDGTSGDGIGSPNVSVGGNATLIYDNPNSDTSPSIEGTYGCEMNGNVTLDIRSGRASEICGTFDSPGTSVIRGDLHIIAGAEKYENTNRTLQLSGNWPIVGAGNRFATEPGAVGNYEVDGNITIDTYENVWSWEKGTTPGEDIPEIYGAIRGNVGGNITINAHGSHVENITGASNASDVGGNVTINAVNVELKNFYYEDPDYDEGDILANYKSTVDGKCLVYVDGGDVNIVRLTTDETVRGNSEITITGSPKIRTGILSTTNYSSAPTGTPAVTLTACTAVIPFIQSAAKVSVINNSDATLNGLWFARDLNVDAGSTLKTDDDVVELEGNVVVNGIWEQLYDEAAGADYDTTVAGTMTVGADGKYICHGSTGVTGNVMSSGMMALMKHSQFKETYTGNDAELRLPVVQTGKNYNTGTIPLRISGLAYGTTTVNTVKTYDWTSLQAPVLKDNYIVTKKNGDSPKQEVFVLGNSDAVKKGLFLKRTDDAAGTSDHYMWQVTAGITVTFDKNGGSTEASPKVEIQEKVSNGANHFELPATEPTRIGYIFSGWNTQKNGKGKSFTSKTDVTENMTVYAQWKQDDTFFVQVYPMDITIYTGGDGYQGVIGDNGKFSANDLPEIGFYFILPDEINKLIGNTNDIPTDLSDRLKITYDDEKGTTRSWNTEMYGDEVISHITMDGNHVYIYRLLESKIDGSGEMTPARMQFTRADGSVMVDSKFPVSEEDQYRNYTISFYTGALEKNNYRVTFTYEGENFEFPVVFKTGSLKVRGNSKEIYREISTDEPTVNKQETGIMLVNAAQENTEYYLNNESINVDPGGVRLLVDNSLDDAVLAAYINQNKNADGKYAYEFRYLDLVDTHNGNAYVSLGAGQKLNLYWPVPGDAAENSEFHIVHFKGMDRESNVSLKELLTTNIPEELSCEKVTIDGQEYIKFSTGSFSPFAIMYEKSSKSEVVPGETPSDNPSVKPEKPSITPETKKPSQAGSTNGNKDTEDQTTELMTMKEDSNSGKTVSATNATKLPQTGQLWWPVWVLMIIGGVMVVGGILYQRKNYEKEKNK